MVLNLNFTTVGAERGAGGRGAERGAGGRGAERGAGGRGAERGAVGRGTGTEPGAGITEIGRRAERLFHRSRSAHMLCYIGLGAV